MKITRSSILALALGTLTVGALAQPATPPDAPDAPGAGAGPGGPGPARRRPALPLVRALDANHDGVIDASEIANASAALKTLDKNNDGQLTREEYMPPRPPGGPGGPDGAKPRPPAPQADDAQNPPPGDDGKNPPPNGDHPGRPPGPRPMAAIVKALDANHDGVIDASEIANASAALKTLDKNNDGELTRDEYLGAPPKGAGQGPKARRHAPPAGE